MKKPVFYTEIAYFLGLVLLACGTALTVYGDYGISMVVAPAYILHLYLSQFWSFFSFGVAEYLLQGIVLLLLVLILKKAKITYLLSFLVTLFYGLCLDEAMSLTALLPANIYLQVAAYVVGAIICCNALALLFCSYLPPEAYELFSKEIAAKIHKPVHLVVNFYNLGSLLIAAILSLTFFGKFQGIGIGTVVCAFLYGFVIRFFQKIYNKLFRFTDKFSLRKHFEEREVPQ